MVSESEWYCGVIARMHTPENWQLLCSLLTILSPCMQIQSLFGTRKTTFTARLSLYPVEWLKMLYCNDDALVDAEYFFIWKSKLWTHFGEENKMYVKNIEMQ